MKLKIWAKKKIKTLRLDNGLEYDNQYLRKFSSEKGIVLDFCPVYVHELNGTAKKLNRTAQDMERCSLAEAKVFKRYWPEIIKTIAYLKNRSLAATTENNTPYEKFFGKNYNLNNLRLYGSRVYA